MYSTLASNAKRSCIEIFHNQNDNLKKKKILFFSANVSHTPDFGQDLCEDGPGLIMADTVCLIYLQYIPDKCRYSKQLMDLCKYKVLLSYVSKLYFHDNFTAFCQYEWVGIYGSLKYSGSLIFPQLLKVIINVPENSYVKRFWIKITMVFCNRLGHGKMIVGFL